MSSSPGAPDKVNILYLIMVYVNTYPIRGKYLMSKIHPKALLFLNLPRGGRECASAQSTGRSHAIRCDAGRERDGVSM